MATTLDERTVRPPESIADREAIEGVAALLRDAIPAPAERSGSRAAQHHSQLVMRSATQEITVPEELIEVVQLVVDALARGQAVVIEPLDAVLTTQQAADKLHISRPTLIKLLKAGKIPFHTLGRHRRIKLGDLLTYEQQAQDARQRELDELSFAAAHDGTADATDEIVETR